MKKRKETVTFSIRSIKKHHFILLHCEVKGGGEEGNKRKEKQSLMMVFMYRGRSLSQGGEKKKAN